MSPRKQRAINPVQVQEQARAVLSSSKHRDVDERTAVQVAKKLDPVTGANWMRCLSDDAARAIDDHLMEIADRLNQVMVIARQDSSWTVPASVAASRDKAARAKAEQEAKQAEIAAEIAEQRQKRADKAKDLREQQRRNWIERNGRQFLAR